MEREIDSPPVRLVVVQFGDYADAVQRRGRGEPETYYGQNYTVDFVAGLTARCQSVAVVTLHMDQPSVAQSNSVVTAGVQLYPAGRRPRHRALLSLLASLEPSHLLLETPHTPSIRWATRNGVRTLPLFFDSFNRRSWRARWRYAQLARALNHPSIRWVGNHGTSAARDLVRIGVHAHKVLPMDWPSLLDPNDTAAWVPSPPEQAFRVAYVGLLSEAKGVGDAIRAIARLRDAQRQFRLTLIGIGDEAGMRQLAGRLGVADRVDFAGRIAHDAVVQQMGQHDAVVVPSRPEYPEGLPMTLYEAFCAKAPLVVSDHPMFKLKVRDGDNALMVPAGNDLALADALRTLADDPDLCQRLSANAAAQAQDFFLPLKWDRVISHWLDDRAEDHAALARFALAEAPAGA